MGSRSCRVTLQNVSGFQIHPQPFKIKYFGLDLIITHVSLRVTTDQIKWLYSTKTKSSLSLILKRLPSDMTTCYGYF